jgi:hypothetical protein
VQAPFAAAAIAALAVWTGQSGSRLPTSPAPTISTSTQVISPVCLMSWVVRATPGARAVELLVFWRGSAGWFLRGTSSSNSRGSASNGVVHVEASFGGIDVEVELVEATRVVRIRGQELPLGAANVVFVDDVDSPKGGRITGTARLDPTLAPGTGAPGVAGILGRSPEVVSFLRCGTAMPGGRGQAMIDRLCAKVSGK